jgi:hypothetical protein
MIFKGFSHSSPYKDVLTLIFITSSYSTCPSQQGLTDKQHICIIVRAFKVQAILNFNTTRPFMHCKFSPLIHLSYVEFGLSYKLMNKHFKLSHSKTEIPSVFCVNKVPQRLIPVAAWSYMWVCSCSFAGILGLNPTGCMDVTWQCYI